MHAGKQRDVGSWVKITCDRCNQAASEHIQLYDVVFHLVCSINIFSITPLYLMGIIMKKPGRVNN
jgi:hypothetical protein